MRIKPTLNDIEEFVRSSTAIAGESYNPGSESGQRHLELAKILSEPFRFVSAELVNARLRGITGGWLRTGTQPNHRGRYPCPEHVGLLLYEWNEWAEASVARFSNGLEHDAERFCWEAHDRLVCIRAFQERNGRTARLQLNLLRGLCGLPWKSILYDDTERYYARVDDYRERVFHPEYKTWCEVHSKDQCSAE